MALSGMALSTVPRTAAEILGGTMLAVLALAACGSGPEGPSGPDPDPGGTGGGGTSLALADSALQAAVEQAAAGTGDAAGLVSLTAKERGIADLGGIEQLTRLEVLDLYGNEIRDLSPLAELRRLRYLDLDLGATPVARFMTGMLANFSPPRRKGGARR